MGTLKLSQSLSAGRRLATGNRTILAIDGKGILVAPCSQPGLWRAIRPHGSIADDGIDPIAGALAVREWRAPFVLILALLGLELHLELLDLHAAGDQEFLDA